MIWGTVPRESCYNNAIFNQLHYVYIEVIAGPFYNIMKVMMKGPNKQSNNNKFSDSMILKYFEFI